MPYEALEELVRPLRLLQNPEKPNEALKGPYKALKAFIRTLRLL